MRAPVDRLAGCAVAGFGVALLALIVPAQVEPVDYGFVRPESLPNALGAALIGLGLAQAAWPGRASPVAWPEAARALLYLALAALAAWGMGRFGFLWVAPVMVLGLMLLLGERRPLWLVLGGLVLPGAVWACVTQLLGRALPG